ncbi:hypothetical protein PHYBLDRAFT_169143 [Phycomyces blakesleeanus NRRL 1555(-)]|uniref:Uncharacterized protein n=1 Tax=Phycomyces blakesleeanus (strain ATCC 8743b / DSM 1359 / FGSC 10004 / NBRC 33097 / NRRL 1555) TaxID=763407 RepID=A0A162X752_PHYB8|nr:hypothetical protein PHYBLDRAFT_169143 [Phycomyces blakesleeanus NRRL 1555(-)]OAD72885.1 hypothetical protein PHYBLDRAFT_169143 [Phycomyces blakesleeanus NRRL 1555(-)]|eukprot:XP_018290925.1 hypothetical protein PHYBLDRAFT_169143 [Phycomyces blakesleeanus NRRL 1555(-)]
MEKKRMKPNLAVVYTKYKHCLHMLIRFSDMLKDKMEIVDDLIKNCCWKKQKEAMLNHQNQIKAATLLTSKASAHNMDNELSLNERCFSICIDSTLSNLCFPKYIRRKRCVQKLGSQISLLSSPTVKYIDFMITISRFDATTSVSAQKIEHLLKALFIVLVTNVRATERLKNTAPSLSVCQYSPSNDCAVCFHQVQLSENNECRQPKEYGFQRKHKKKRLSLLSPPRMLYVLTLTVVRISRPISFTVHCPIVHLRRVLERDDQGYLLLIVYQLLEHNGIPNK